MPMYGGTFSPTEIDTAALSGVRAVVEALGELQTAYDRWREATTRERELRRIAEQAPQEDITSVMNAVSSGAAKLPAPTERKAAEALAEAERVRIACERLCLQAEQRAHDVIDEHRETLRAQQKERLENAADEVLAAIDALQQKMTVAGLEASRLIQVGYPESDPLRSVNPMRWDVYDPRYDGGLDAYVTLDLLARYATDMKPSTIAEKELKAHTEWTTTVDGTNPRYKPSGADVRVRT